MSLFSFTQGPIKTITHTVKKSDLSHGADVTACRVTVHWTISHAMNVTSYRVRVSPPATPCGVMGECVVRREETEFERRALSLELQLGVEYWVTVTTTNCGTQTGGESDPIIILLDCKSSAQHLHSECILCWMLVLSPDPASRKCTVLPLYHNGSLFNIEITWERLLSVRLSWKTKIYSYPTLYLIGGVE